MSRLRLPGFGQVDVHMSIGHQAALDKPLAGTYQQRATSRVEMEFCL